MTLPLYAADMDALKGKRSRRRMRGCSLCDHVGVASIPTAGGPSAFILVCRAHVERLAEIAETTPDALLALYPLQRPTGVRHRATHPGCPADGADGASGAPATRPVRLRECGNCERPFEAKSNARFCPTCRPRMYHRNDRTAMRAEPRCHCGAVIPWNGRGQAPRECPACEPPRRRYLRERQRAKDAARRERREVAA